MIVEGAITLRVRLAIALNSSPVSKYRLNFCEVIYLSELIFTRSSVVPLSHKSEKNGKILRYFSGCSGELNKVS